MSTERLNEEYDRFEVPGGWIYRTWLLKPAVEPGVMNLGGASRVQMQAVFVPKFESGPATVQAISAVATVHPGPSPAPPLADPDSSLDPTAWPKDYARQACDVWISRWGSGSAPGDVIAMNLRQVKKGGAAWDAVLRSFRRYVETVEDAYASPAAWRKRWRAYDPEEPEFDHESAQIADSYDRSLRKARRGGGLQPLGQALRTLPEGRKAQ